MHAYIHYFHIFIRIMKIDMNATKITKRELKQTNKQINVQGQKSYIFKQLSGNTSACPFKNGSALPRCHRKIHVSFSVLHPKKVNNLGWRWACPVSVRLLSRPRLPCLVPSDLPPVADFIHLFTLYKYTFLSPFSYQPLFLFSFFTFSLQICTTSLPNQ